MIVIKLDHVKKCRIIRLFLVGFVDHALACLCASRIMQEGSLFGRVGQDGCLEVGNTLKKGKEQHSVGGDSWTEPLQKAALAFLQQNRRCSWLAGVSSGV